MPGKDLGVRKIGAALLVVGLWAGACGSPTKEDIIGKARNVSTRAELEKALGKPTDIGKLGPVETWTYKASNGEVVFLLIGDKVTLQATSTPEKKN
jgi:hypothetical protein